MLITLLTIGHHPRATRRKLNETVKSIIRTWTRNLTRIWQTVLQLWKLNCEIRETDKA